MKNLLKSKKGITLIALVITIIVLLILAGVTVATLTGENGLLAKAQLAKERNIEAEQDERDKLDSYENELSNYGTWERTGGTVTISEDEYNILKNANSYSTTEKVVGKWIDNKPLYEKTIEVTTPSTINTVNNAADLPADYEKIFIKNAFFITSDAVIQENRGDDINVWIRLANNSSGSSKIAIKTSDTDYTSRTGYITLQYTKTETNNN